MSTCNIYLWEKQEKYQIFLAEKKKSLILSYVKSVDVFFLFLYKKVFRYLKEVFVKKHEMSQSMRKGYLSHRRPAKVQASSLARAFAVRIHVVETLRKRLAKIQVCSPNMGLRTGIWRTTNWKTIWFLFHMPSNVLILLGPVVQS